MDMIQISKAYNTTFTKELPNILNHKNILHEIRNSIKNVNIGDYSKTITKFRDFMKWFKERDTDHYTIHLMIFFWPTTSRTSYENQPIACVLSGNYPINISIVNHLYKCKDLDVETRDYSRALRANLCVSSVRSRYIDPELMINPQLMLPFLQRMIRLGQDYASKIMRVELGSLHKIRYEKARVAAHIEMRKIDLNEIAFIPLSGSDYLYDITCKRLCVSSGRKKHIPGITFSEYPHNILPVCPDTGIICTMNRAKNWYKFTSHVYPSLSLMPKRFTRVIIDLEKMSLTDQEIKLANDIDCDIMWMCIPRTTSTETFVKALGMDNVYNYSDIESVIKDLICI